MRLLVYAFSKNTMDFIISTLFASVLFRIFTSFFVSHGAKLGMFMESQ